MHPFFWLNLLTAVIAGSLSIVVGRRRSALGSQPFAFLMAGVAVWSLAYGLELASTSFATMRWWLWVEYLGIATAPVSWFLFALQYAGYRTRLTRPRVAALFLIPGVTILLNATNGLHGLYYRRMAVDRSGPFPLLDLAPGPGTGSISAPRCCCSSPGRSCCSSSGGTPPAPTTARSPPPSRVRASRSS